uniref:L-Fucosyltransferase n=1 Tax=Anopheles christyi TaxID=43041 RepID=A0A182JR67_9DIPT
MLRFTFQLVRRNIKPLILIVSFLTFIWLIVDTAHRPEFVRHASKHSFRFGSNANEPEEHWYDRTMGQFLELLEIDSNITADESRNSFEPMACPRVKTMVFTAFTGNSQVENLWHYFSLIAIQNSYNSSSTDYRIQIMLTNGTSTELGEIFESIPFEVINMKIIWCFPYKSILNSDTSIEFGKSYIQLFVLNNQAKRLQEIVKVPWEQQKQFFRLRTEAANTAKNLLHEMRQRSKLYGDEEDVNNLQFVGIHIREEDQLPYEYYYRAMTFHRKMHDTGALLFVIICENPKSIVCSMLNEQSERIEVIDEHNEADVDFALLTYCNHSILSNERDIFPSLLRGFGNVVVYGEQHDRSQHAIELASFKENWYSIV